MKTLLILRHAKSDWSAEYGRDHDRPLNSRGKCAAALMGRYLAALEQLPDHVISSTAVRARDTVGLAADAGDWSCGAELTGSLYEASPEAVLQVVRSCDDAFQRLLIAGHEPTWSLLAGSLIGNARLKFPTAALVRIDFDVNSWSQVAFDDGTLVWMVTPKLLERIG